MYLFENNIIFALEKTHTGLKRNYLLFQGYYIAIPTLRMATTMENLNSQIELAAQRPVVDAIFCSSMQQFDGNGTNSANRRAEFLMCACREY